MYEEYSMKRSVMLRFKHFLTKCAALYQYYIWYWWHFKPTAPSRPHSRPPAAQEEDEDEERNITSSTSTDGQSLVVEAAADASSHQQQLPSNGEEGDEGSCELSDDVSRDSTMGSDSDTFSSPFCLSPVSEALCESSGSVFLDNETRSVRRSKWAPLVIYIVISTQQREVYSLSISQQNTYIEKKMKWCVECLVLEVLAGLSF